MPPDGSTPGRAVAMARDLGDTGLLSHALNNIGVAYWVTGQPRGRAMLDESLAVGDGECVLVPRGYHTVSAPPGYDLYYLNVMAGPQRHWVFRNDPAHEWLLKA